MDDFILSKQNPVKEFNLLSKDSYLKINSIFILTNDKKNFTWSEIANSIQITAELKYVVYIDPQGRFVDDRIKRIPIYLFTEPNQKQPIYNINRQIKNETFTVGINPEKKFYSFLTLKLNENINEQYSLRFIIEKYDIE